MTMTSRSKPFYHYLLSCGLLLLPVMLWDTVLTPRLPPAYQAEVFWNNIPPLIRYGETGSRLLLFLLAFTMPLPLQNSAQRKGLALYAAGILLYFLSWLPLILDPGSGWSQGAAGFMAPAYTPALWLCGMGLTGDSFYFKIRYRPWFFLVPAFAFLVCHNLHAFLVYSRLH